MPWTEQDRAIMRDIYCMLRDHPDPDGTKAYQDALCNHGKDIYNKYHGHPLAAHMAASVIEYYGEKQKQTMQNDFENGDD